MGATKTNLRYRIMVNNKLARRHALYDYMIRFPGVRAVTWWYTKETDTLTIVLKHAWWSWRGLKNRNRRRALSIASDLYAAAGIGPVIEVI